MDSLVCSWVVDIVPPEELDHVWWPLLNIAQKIDHVVEVVVEPDEIRPDNLAGENRNEVVAISNIKRRDSF